MGDVRVSPPRENDALPGDDPPLALESRSLNPHPSKIGADSWRLAEQTVEGIIQRIQPTRVSDQRRGQVVEYVRNLIKGVAYAEVLLPLTPLACLYFFLALSQFKYNRNFYLAISLLIHFHFVYLFGLDILFLIVVS